MFTFLKKIIIYFLIAAGCISAYFVGRSIQEKKQIEKEIVYASRTASELYMVWGINELRFPPKDLWPGNSYTKDSLVYTKMENTNDTFRIKLKLPNNTILNYWMVQTKDKKGNSTDLWDAGGNDRKYFIRNFNDDGILNPGYFIFLAGFLPLLLFFFRNRSEPGSQKSIASYEIGEHVPQFDSIRAIAVLLVIVHHWLAENRILNFLPNGALGVNIFFVLSGFLITGILLKAKKQTGARLLKRSTAFRNFYIRRTLRIFPIYYLLLIIFSLLNDPAIKDDSIYYFTYTSNYLFYAQQFFPARLAHLWSLAVEEQFYIIWPWLILLINKRYLSYLIAAFILIGISSNYIFASNGWWAQLLTPACFDAFAIGGFLSWMAAYRPDAIEMLRSKFKWIAGLILLLFILAVFGFSFLPGRTIHALLAATVIFYCLFKKNSVILNYVLDNKWLIRIGKISYGVYLYHLFIPELWGYVINKFAAWHIDLLYNEAMPAFLKPVWLFIQQFGFLMLICILSWKLIEKPVNLIKKKFENKIPARK